ncbi:MAG: YbaN family protein [Methanomassiliicoccales archaeon]
MYLECEPKSKLARWSLITAGTLSLVLGLFGIFVPVLPTTPFLLLAAACYARGSQRFYCWLINNRLFGTYIRSYQEGRGLPLRVRAFTIIMLWLTIGSTVVLFIDEGWLKVLLLAIAMVVTVHVASLRPKERCDLGRE